MSAMRHSRQGVVEWKPLRFFYFVVVFLETNATYQSFRNVVGTADGNKLSIPVQVGRLNGRFGLLFDVDDCQHRGGSLPMNCFSRKNKGK